MPLDLINYENVAKAAVKSFWASRDAARQKQATSGRADQGERAGVTAGKNMDGFTNLFVDLIRANGLEDAEIHQQKRVLTLPGYFRPTKLWDILVIREKRLIAALEMKSQVGPSFGNNFNNRTEEAIGTAHDFWTAYREDAFGSHPKPFVGWMIHVEDAPGSSSPVTDRTPHYDVFPEFKGASYKQRYDVLCQRLVKEQLYSAACVVTSSRESVTTGGYNCLSALTSLKTFVSGLAGHIAAEAVR